MSAPDQMPPELEALLHAEAARSTQAFIAAVTAWPSYRRQIAYASLGLAVAMADMMGADAEDFLRGLRAEHPKPAPLVPPRSS